MFDQDDPNNPGPFTSTVSLRDDPEPALQRELQRAREERYVARFVRVFGPIGLVVLLALLFDVYNDYVAHKRELPALVSRGQRVPAQLSGEPKNVGGRFDPPPDRWHLSSRADTEAAGTGAGRVRGAHSASVTPPREDSPDKGGMPGTDVAFWGSPCAMHRAIWDYWPNGRKGRRVTIRGDRPR